MTTYAIEYPTTEGMKTMLVDGDLFEVNENGVLQISDGSRLVAAFTAWISARDVGGKGVRRLKELLSEFETKDPWWLAYASRW